MTVRMPDSRMAYRCYSGVMHRPARFTDLVNAFTDLSLIHLFRWRFWGVVKIPPPSLPVRSDRVALIVPGRPVEKFRFLLTYRPIDHFKNHFHMWKTALQCLLYQRRNKSIDQLRLIIQPIFQGLSDRLHRSTRGTTGRIAGLTRLLRFQVLRIRHYFKLHIMPVNFA